MMRKVLACATLLSLAAGACAEGAGGEALAVRAIPLGGQVVLFHGDDSSLLEQETILEAGDRLVSADDGRALVRLPGGRSVELAPGADLGWAGPGGAEVRAGSVLARASSALTIRAAGADIEGSDAVFRVDRELSTRLAVYRGEASVVGSGVGAIPALRETTLVAGGAVPRGARPLRVSPNDPWDINFLGAAIDIGLELDRLQRGLARQLPAQGPEAVTEVLSEDFPRRILEDLLERISPAESVVAAVAAREAAALVGQSLVQVLRNVLDLRLLGADWTVVVAQWELTRSEILAQLNEVTDLIARFVAHPAALQAVSGGRGGPAGGVGSLGAGSTGSAGGGSAEGGGSTGDDGGGTTTTGDGGGGTTTTGDGGAGTGTTSGTAPSPPPPGCENEIECTLEDVVGDLGGDLGLP
jgi:hypothetical protein